jgi:hypothetical protein
VLPTRKPRRPRLTPLQALKIVREPRTARFDLLTAGELPIHTRRSVKPACAGLKGPARSRIEH